MKSFNIRKSSGEEVPFDPAKLRRSLSRSGADEATISEVMDAVQVQLYEHIPTNKIYKSAFQMLKRHSKGAAARYKLQKAIIELGPSGYPFEQYIGAIYKSKGYHVEVGTILEGECVTHETDVLAKRGNEILIIECKFHSTPSHKNDVKVPLYVHARFNDIKKRMTAGEDQTSSKIECRIITNTRFTSDAIRYAACSGIILTGWEFPEKDNLRNMIDSSGLHPVTCMTSLQRNEKSALLGHNIVLCKDLFSHTSVLQEIRVRPSRIATIMKEMETLCGANITHEF